MKTKRTSYISLLSFFILILAFYGLDRYAISDYDDDVYKFITKDRGDNYIDEALNGTGEFEPVRSIKDIIDSQNVFYRTSNGRYLIQGTAQFFSSFVSMDCFVICNTIVFAIFFYLIIKLCFKDKRTITGVMFVISVFWLFVYKGVGFLGSISGSTNYLWAALAYFAYYYKFERIGNDSESVISSVSLFLLSVLVGSLSESFCIGFAGAFVFHCIINRYRVTSLKSIMTIGFIIGACICVFAPGNFSRAEGRVSGLNLNISALYQVFTTPVFLLFFMSFMFLLGKSINKTKEYLKQNHILLLSLVLNIAFAVLIAYNSKSQLTCVCIISMILLARLYFDTLNVEENIIRYVTIALIMICILSYKPIYELRKGIYDGYQSAVEQAVKKTDGIVIDEEYERYRYKIMTNPFVRDYFAYNISFSKATVSLRLTNGKSRTLIQKNLPFKPDSIAQMCTDIHMVKNNLYKIKNGFYVYKSNKTLPLEKVTIDFHEHYALVLLRSAISHGKALESFVHNNLVYYVFPNTLQYGNIVSVTEHD